VFGGLFAVNSSLHSYLILAFTRAERVTMDVGFYYMANAAGRLIGTVLSGLTYQLGGLPLTLGTAAVMLLCSAWAAGHLRAAREHDGAIGIHRRVSCTICRSEFPDVWTNVTHVSVAESGPVARSGRDAQKKSIAMKA
jgi:hypothetical protein